MSTALSIAIILFCTLGEAFFSGSEIAIISVDRIRLRHAAKKGNRSSRLALEMLRRPEWILGTTLIGTNIFTILSTTVAAALFYNLIGAIGIPVSIAVMSFVNWTFAEIVPKSVFQHRSNTITPRLAYILRTFSLLMYPAVWLFSKIAILLTCLITGDKPDSKMPFISKEELKLLMKMGKGKGDVKSAERKMIKRILSFTETEVKEIIVPLIDVDALTENTSIDDAVRKFVQTKHRRLPVFGERIDNIIGILNSFDILNESGKRKIKPFIRPAFYIPPNTSVADLLEQMQSSGNSMAIVIDEYGGAEGIVTIEDILEEVVGEIEDEYDSASPLFRVQDDKTIIVSGRMEVDEINERFDLDIPEGDYESIGGFVINTLKRIPRHGETIKMSKAILTVRKSTSRVVTEIKIQTFQS